MRRDLRTKNFTFNEVAHRPEGLTPDIEPITYIAMGYLQCLRDAAQFHFKKQVGITLTSGVRVPAINQTTKGSAANSYHQWRVDKNKQAVWAVDTVPSGITLQQWYTFAQQYVQGEVYLNRKEKIVHIAPYGPDETFVV